MANATIKKASIKDGMFLNVEYSESMNDGFNKVKKDCTAPIHDDLRRAFVKLNIHLALLCHQAIENNKKAAKAFSVKINDDEEEVVINPDEEFRLDDYNLEVARSISCVGFSIGGDGGHEGVTLIGSRTLANGKVLNLVSPFQKWSDDNYNYAHSFELSEIIEECKGEVAAYLFEGKHAPDKQMTLAFEEEEQ